MRELLTTTVAAAAVTAVFDDDDNSNNSDADVTFVASFLLFFLHIKNINSNRDARR